MYLLEVAFAIFFDIVHSVIADRRRLEVELHWHIELKLIRETRLGTLPTRQPCHPTIAHRITHSPPPPHTHSIIFLVSPTVVWCPFTHRAEKNTPAPPSLTCLGDVSGIQQRRTALHNITSEQDKQTLEFRSHTKKYNTIIFFTEVSSQPRKENIT